MAPPLPGSLGSLYENLELTRLQQYQQDLQVGKYRPFIYPWDSLSALWLLVALLVFPKLPDRVFRYVRLPTFVLILGHCIYVGRSCRTIGFAGGYGIGLAAMWGCIMTVTLLLVKDLKTDFQRLEVRQVDIGQEIRDTSNGSATFTTTSSDASSNGSLNKRKNATPPATTSGSNSNNQGYTLEWQGCPSSFGHLLDWNIDLVTAFRGVNWNFRNPTLAPLSSTITKTAHASSGPALRQIQLNALGSFIFYCILTDVVKSTCIQDPYFLGLAPLSSSSPYHFLRPHRTLTRLFRLLLAVSSTQIVLAMIFHLSPLLFPILPQRLTRTPLHHPSAYPPYFSPPLSVLSHSGLAGFWGKCWHQLFRHGISQPGIYLSTSLRLDPKSSMTRAIQLLTAFFLSGCIHAAASYTSYPPNGNTSRPISGPLSFFVLQGVGILLQTGFVRTVNSKAFPGIFRKAGNIAFVLLWLYLTGPLLADDFSRCGVWLFEPLPISLVRGIRGDGWWKWGGRWAGWSEKEEWWLKGIAVY